MARVHPCPVTPLKQMRSSWNISKLKKCRLYVNHVLSTCHLEPACTTNSAVQSSFFCQPYQTALLTYGQNKIVKQNCTQLSKTRCVKLFFFFIYQLISIVFGQWLSYFCYWLVIANMTTGWLTQPLSIKHKWRHSSTTLSSSPSRYSIQFYFLTSYVRLANALNTKKWQLTTVIDPIWITFGPRCLFFYLMERNSGRQPISECIV